MDSYREGDLVKVHGEILNQKGSIFLGGPQYRVQSIEMIDRDGPLTARLFRVMLLRPRDDTPTSRGIFIQ